MEQFIKLAYLSQLGQCQDIDNAIVTHTTHTHTHTHTDLLRVHVAVVVQVLVVQGEASWVARACGGADAGAPLDVLTHHQHGVVQHALGALGHGVHPDHEDDVHDALQVDVWE